MCISVSLSRFLHNSAAGGYSVNMVDWKYSSFFSLIWPENLQCALHGNQAAEIESNVSVGLDDSTAAAGFICTIQSPLQSR